jgi:hypothetical protein
MEARRGRVEAGEMRFDEGVRYGLHHGRPRELFVNVALCWRVPESRARDPRRELPEEPWHLASSLNDPRGAVNWHWQRGWIEQSFKDAKSRFGLWRVRVGCPERLSRLLVALTIALSMLAGSDGAAGGRRDASPLARSGGALGKGQHNQLGPGAARRARRFAALSFAPILAHRVGEYASEEPPGKCRGAFEVRDLRMRVADPHIRELRVGSSQWKRRSSAPISARTRPRGPRRLAHDVEPSHPLFRSGLSLP